MRWPWTLTRKLNLEDRTTAIMSGSARLASEVHPNAAALEKDLSYLIALKEDNRNIAEMVRTPGFAEYEAALKKIALEKLRSLPRKVLRNEADVAWDAAVIDLINSVLLGLTSNALYESANLERLINDKLTAKARLEESK